MCPDCLSSLSSLSMMVAGGTSTGWVATVLIHRFRARKVDNLRVVSREEWITARKELLARQNNPTQQRDTVSADPAAVAKGR